MARLIVSPLGTHRRRLAKRIDAGPNAWQHSFDYVRTPRSPNGDADGPIAGGPVPALMERSTAPDVRYRALQRSG